MTINDQIRRLDKLFETGDGAISTGPISRTVIGEFESRLQVTFPADYVTFLSERGGIYPPPLALLEGTRLWSIPDFRFFGAGGDPREIPGIASAHEDVIDRCVDGLDEDGAVIEPDWGPMLVPFAGRPPSRWFCFDFYFDAENPPVVEMLTDGEWSRSDAFDGIRYVADSFVDFLTLVRAAPAPGDPVERYEPYESDRKTQWEQRLHRWLFIT